MKRRDLLSALATSSLTAGCSADDSVLRKVTLVEINNPLTDYDLNLEVKVLVSEVTNLDTAKIRLTLTNEGEQAH